jgi:hypothetical protein
MRAGRHDAKVMKEIAAIRSLQRRAAEMDAVRAEAERRAAEERHAEGRDAVRAAEEGWSIAVGSAAFDLSGSWLHALGVRETEAQALGRDEDRATDAAAERRRAFQDATARSDAADDRARAAARAVVRERDESRIAMVEDRFAARRRQA